MPKKIDENKVEEEKDTKEEIDIKKLKKELTTYIDNQIFDKFNFELDKVNKKIIREKSRKILLRDLIIILLVALCLYLVYLLYDNRFFDKFFIKNTELKEVIKEEKKEEQATSSEEVKPTLSELKEKYASLLDNIYINEKSEYLNDYYKGNLTNELKLYFVLNSINIDNIIKENEYSIIEENLLNDAYSSLYIDKYNAASFKYNGNQVKYISLLKSYISEKVITKNKTNIQREIYNIQVTDDEIIIKTYEGLVKDNKLYNILDNSNIENYKKDSLLNYKDKLNKVVYSFDKNNKLLKIQDK
ncbi:MAG: hypothetical protein IJ572_02395 [Bacilli bacterium]|nr:hypothetical protein [Bacilli bacterium]